VRALIRDERRLRAAIAHQEQLRFDADAAVMLRERTTDMLETLAVLGHDDDFWAHVGRGSALPPDRLSRLRSFDPGSLTVLLEVFGYRSPPPPSVDVLVDEVSAELATALQGGSTPPSAAAIQRARAGLLLTHSRIRRQLDAGPAYAAGPGVLRTAARRAAETAGWVIPSAAAAAAGIAAEMVIPGLGLVAAAAAKKVVEDGTQMATTFVLARLIDGSVPDEAGPPGRPGLDGGDDAHPARNHAVQLVDLLSGAAAGVVLTDHRRAVRHVERIAELVRDRHSGEAALVQHSDRLREAVRAIDCACPPGGPYGDPRGDAVTHALGLARHMVEMLPQTTGDGPGDGRGTDGWDSI
jgi:hypothetical protein